SRLAETRSRWRRRSPASEQRRAVAERRLWRVSGGHGAGARHAGSRPVCPSRRSRGGAASSTSTMGPNSDPVARGGERRDELRDGFDLGLTDVVGLAGGSGDVPAVHDEFGPVVQALSAYCATAWDGAHRLYV